MLQNIYGTKLQYMRRIILLLTLLSPLLLLAQPKTNELPIPSDLKATHQFNGHVFCYLEFQTVPTEEQKQMMLKNEITLYQYQPDLKWFASFPESTLPKTLSTVGVKKLITKPLSHKIDNRILRSKVPPYAEVGGETKAVLTVASTTDYAAFQKSLEAIGVNVSSTFKPLGLMEISGAPKALIEAAKLPFAIYLELINPPKELEIEDEMTMTRAPFINGYYNLDGLNGDGVTIAVNEGGRVDSLYNPDFKNRLDRSLEGGNTSGHKTGVSWRMASAGNIDPTDRGQAWGANLMSGGINFTNAAQANVNIVNNSFGYGCISGNATYSGGAALNDFLVRTNSRFMITYSCGNIGGSSCSSYGAGPGWGSITGLVKSAKNIFAVGAMNSDEQLTGFSSKGPAMDGRILPDITATGPGGTSHASPNLAGVNALLTQAYRQNNGNQWPKSGLIKAIILNTADDIENPGPDFRTGFGRVNAKRGLELIQNSQWLTDSVANASTKTHSISVPAGVSQLKVSVYWTDHEATAGITGKTLVNNLDLRLQLPTSSAWILPWVLNTFPANDSLILPAFHGVDTLNNVELITIDNPTAGNYTAEVSGTLVPFGPQRYHVVYSYVYDSIEVIYPKGGEGLVPGENRRIRWDALDSGNSFDIEFSADSGTTWQTVATGLAGDQRSYNWTIPSVNSGEGLIKITSGTQVATSENTFSVVAPPNNLNLVWRCADSAIFSWDSVPGASGYRVYRLGNQFMDTASVTSNTYASVYNLSASENEWVSVQTMLPDSGSSRRAIALEIPPGDFNCIGNDLSVVQIISPEPGYYPSCLTNDSLTLSIKLQNIGTSSLPYLPVAYQFNGNAVVHDTLFSALNSANEDIVTFPSAILMQAGTNTLKVWSTYPGDANALNDTLEVAFESYTSGSISLPYSQSFDSFNTCSSAWGCASITCNLSQNWFNLPNLNVVDSIDWRTKSGGTGSGGTGPSGDHTSGNGNYLYLEGSGNGGSGCQNHTAQMYSPCIDLTGTNSPTVSYWYHAYGNAIGGLHMDVLANGVWHMDVASPVVGPQGNQWNQQQADLSAFSGETVILSFRGRTGGGWLSDLAIDDINISTLPLANFETTSDTFCLGQTIPLQNLTTYATTYTWSVLQNSFSYSSGNGSSTNPTIAPNDTGWYDVQLIASNATGNDTLLYSNFFYVADFNAPTVVSDAPNNTYCFGDSAVFTADGAFSSYEFYQNGNLVQSGNDSIWNTSSFHTGDSIWVVTPVNAGCSYQSNKLGLTVQPDIRSFALSADDNDYVICEGDTVIFTALFGMNQYDFYRNGSIVESSADSIFQTDQLMDGDEIYCAIFDNVGCTGNSDTLTWIVNPTPATPTVLTQGLDSLRASVVANAYQWWKDASQLTETTQVIAAQGTGLYQVQAIMGACSSEASDAYEYLVSNVQNNTQTGVVIFPNPARVTLNIALEAADYSEVIIYDATGRMVLSGSLMRGLNSFPIESLASGFYTLRLSGAAGNLKQPLIIN